MNFGRNFMSEKQMRKMACNGELIKTKVPQKAEIEEEHKHKQIWLISAESCSQVTQEKHSGYDCVSTCGWNPPANPSLLIKGGIKPACIHAHAHAHAHRLESELRNGTAVNWLPPAGTRSDREEWKIFDTEKQFEASHLKYGEPLC